MAAAAASARRTAATNGKDPDRPRRPSKKEADQVGMMAQLLALQEKVAQMEGKLEESVEKEKVLEQRLEEQILVTEELKEEIKEKDDQLMDYENRLKNYE